MRNHYTSYIFRLPLIIATVMMTASCTLSMEDYIVPEEEKGFDEVVTEAYDCGEVSYQFHEDVVRFTEELQESYLVRIEDDSILYLSESMPKKSRPYVGGKIWAGYSHAIPHGLNSKVLSVENQGGLLKVVTSTTTREDVFKHLSYNFDAEFTAGDLSAMTPEVLEEMGCEVRDSIIIDWSRFDESQGKKGIRTRAGEEKKDTIVETVSWLADWKFDTRDWSKAKLFFNINDFNTWYDACNKAAFPGSKYFDWNPYMALVFQCAHKVVTHTERNEERNYEENYTIVWDSVTVGLDAGISPTPSKPKSDEEIGKMNDLMTSIFAPKGSPVTRREAAQIIQNYSNLGARQAKAGKLKIDKDKGRIYAEFVFNPWFSVMFEAKIEPIFEMDACIGVRVSYVTDKHKTGSITKDGNKVDIDEDLGGGHLEVPYLGASGSIKVGVHGRAGIGIKVGGVAGVTIGANLEAAIKGEFQMNFRENDEWGVTPSGKLQAYLSFWGDLTFHVCPLGLDIWSHELIRIPNDPIYLINFSSKFEPKVGTLIGYANLHDEIIDAKASVSYSNLDGMQPLLLGNGQIYYPCMRMYRGPISDGNYVYLDPVDENGNVIPPSSFGRIQENKDYNFRYYGIDDDDVMEIHFQPALCSFNTESEFSSSWNDFLTTALDNVILSDHTQFYEVGKPVINTHTSFQTYGGPNYDFTDSQGALDVNSSGDSGGASFDPKTLSQFKFMSCLDVRNGSRLQEWGVKVYIYDPNKKRIFRRRVPINHNASGRYTLVFSFITNWKPSRTMTDGSEETLFYRVIPYWGDENGGQKVDAQDTGSKAYREIKAELMDITPQEKEGMWGSIMPEIDLD